MLGVWTAQGVCIGLPLPDTADAEGAPEVGRGFKDLSRPVLFVKASSHHEEASEARGLVAASTSESDQMTMESNHGVPSQGWGEETLAVGVGHDDMAI